MKVQRPTDPSGRDFTGYGRRPPRIEWPDGARLALNIALNYETGAEYSFADGDGRNEAIAELPGFAVQDARNLQTESIYEYASRAGAFRLLRIFDEFGIKTTCFAAAKALERNPEICEWLRESNHEVCAHGLRWNDEDVGSTIDAEQSRITEAVRLIADLCGERPVGWLSRRPSENTRVLLARDGGFLYDSNSYADDLPYYVDVESAPLLVIPYTLVYNDAKFFFGGFNSPSDFVDYCTRAIDIYLSEAGECPKMMSIGIHGRWMGQAGRASAMAEVIAYAKSRGGVWFSRRDEIARWWLSTYPPEM